MDSKWIVIRLCDFVDVAEEAECIKSEMRRLFGESSDFFIPVTVDEIHGSKHLSVLIEGYVFLKEASIQNSRRLFYNQPLSKNIEGPIICGDYEYQTISDAELANMKSRAQRTSGTSGIKVGEVFILSKGPFEGMEAIVLEVDNVNKLASISIKTRTREVLMREKISNLVKKNL